MSDRDTPSDISRALERITLQMTSNLHLDEVLQAVTDGLVDELGAAAAYIWLLEEEETGPRLTLDASAGLPLGSTDGAPRGIHGIVERRDHFCTNRLPTDGSVGAPAWLLENGLRSLGGFPLLFRAELLGVMAVFSKTPFSDRAFERLFLFAHQAAVAIANARLYTQVEELSSRLTAENRYLRDEAERDHNCGDIVGTSPAIRRVLAEVEQVAPTDSTVLIEGETGTGKELMALSIHNKSRRQNRALVKVNCGAISAGLVESELFGHEKGAFTGAVERRIGRFELADGGTLFLDEVGELPLETQVKLLRALQEQEFERLGSSRSIQVDVRVIAATNRDLAEDVAGGKFRADLYYRLNVFPLRIPPLRERLADAPLIAGCALGRIAEKIGRPIEGFTDASLERLQSYGWPGNVRELLNVVERAAILSRGPLIEIDPSLIGNRSAGGSAPGLTTLAEVERQHLERVLEHTGGVVEGPNGAARILGIIRAHCGRGCKSWGSGSRREAKAESDPGQEPWLAVIWNR